MLMNEAIKLHNQGVDIPVDKAIEIHSKGIDVPVNDGNPSFYKELTEEEMKVLELYKENRYVHFHTHNCTEEEAIKLVSRVGKPKKVTYDGHSWYGCLDGKIEITAFLKEDAPSAATE